MYENESDLLQPQTKKQPSVLSVSSLNKMAKSLLEGNFPAVLVEAEISNLAQPASGHWYLTLKDKNAQIRCAMFRGNNSRVRFKPANGQQVLVKGRLSIYEARGDYQFIADSMEEAGAGALQRAFEELKAKLDIEGLFNPELKQEIRDDYGHVGVITSATGAAIQDILSVFERRFPATKITLFPVAVQGLDAPTEIVKAVGLANKHAAKLSIEALIVGRGGGSLEDLQAFNEESVARAIFGSELPMTSAVGHEIDFTIADFVADLRAPTPSAAAEVMSRNQDEYFEYLTGYGQQLSQIVRSKFQHAQQQLAHLIRQLKHPRKRLEESAQHLDRLEDRMSLAMNNRIAMQRSELRQLQSSLLAISPQQTIQRASVTLDNNIKNLRHAVKNLLTAKQAQLAELSRGLNAISPLDTLARGYSITYGEESKVLRSSDDVQIGSKIKSRLGNGSIVSTVDLINSGDKEDSDS